MGSETVFQKLKGGVLASEKSSLTPFFWRGRGFAHAGPEGIPTGFEALDGGLPGRGWPAGALTEILLERHGIGELQLVMPALRRLSRQDRWIVWVCPPYLPYGPALSNHELDQSRLLLIRGQSAEEGLWAAEQALASGVSGGVLLWQLHGAEEKRTPFLHRSLRRLQLAAERGNGWAVLFRPWEASAHASPAALRLHLTPRPEGLLEVRVLKCRGRAPGAPIRLELFSP